MRANAIARGRAHVSCTRPEFVPAAEEIYGQRRVHRPSFPDLGSLGNYHYYQLLLYYYATRFHFEADGATFIGEGWGPRGGREGEGGGFGHRTPNFLRYRATRTNEIRAPAAITACDYSVVRNC